MGDLISQTISEPALLLVAVGVAVGLVRLVAGLLQIALVAIQIRRERRKK